MGEGENEPYWDEQSQRWVMGTAPPGPPAPPGLYDPAPRPPNSWVLPATRSRVAVLLTAAAVLGGGLGFGVWALLRDGGGPADARPGTSVSASPTGPASESNPPASASPSTVADEPPEGFQRVEDPGGFRLDVPTGWQRSEDGTGIFYKSSDERGLIQIFRLDGPEATPYDALLEAERFLKNNKNYERLGLQRLGPGDGSDAELDYAYDSEKTGPRRVLDRVFTAPDSEMYAVLVAGPREDWPEQRDIQEVVLGAFCPTGFCDAGDGGAPTP
ncbi:hypothetical protein [Streptomyces sp. 8N616]|uniref:hypothetical protein n=1 Tax=Streptomyces sp. 8N616 TaxID=3457414 RepID=UPI003FD12068